MDPEFLELLSSTVTIERFTGEDVWGNNTYATGVPVRCYVDEDQETFQSQETDAGSNIGTDSVAATLYIDYTNPPFQEGDRVTLGTRVLRITTQRVFYDENGPYHQVLTLGNNQER